MGNNFGFQGEDNIVNQRIPPNEFWLKNKMFHIKGEYYTLLNRLGGGTFGSVWSSTMQNGDRAAVKVFDLRRIRMDMSPMSLIDSFKEEVKMCYKLRDAKSHVVNIYGFDFDFERRVALISMELGDHTLEERVKYLNIKQKQNPQMRIIGDFISSKDRKSIWIQIVEIIFVLNQHNIIHRDMKPANFVFFGPILKIVDLGIAQKAIAGYNSNKLGGTPFYSAPECINGRYPITTKADIWSTGAILYYLTYGFPPVSLSPQPPPGHFRTRSVLVEDILHNSLQLNPLQRPSHRWFAQHPLTIGPQSA